MSVPAINDLLDLAKVAEALYVPLKSEALPIETTCPVCNKPAALRLFHDTVRGGYWHHCQSCHRFGDLVDLAASAWEIPRGLALTRLVEESCPPGSSSVVTPKLLAQDAQSVAARNAVDQIWQEARNRIAAGKTDAIAVGKLCRHLGFKLNGSSAERFLNTAGHLYGGTRLFDLLQACGIKKANNIVSNSRRHWQDVVITPYYDLPDRICMFGAIGRKLRPGEDEVYRHTWPDSRDKNAVREAGLAHIRTVEMAGSPTTVLAVDDWLFATKVQVRQLNAGMPILPLVVWRNDGRYVTQDGWQQLYGHKLVLWTFRLDYRVIVQAIQQNAKIVVLGPRRFDRKHVHDWLWKDYPPPELQQTLLKHADPWQQVLRRRLGSMAKDSADQVIRQLAADGEDVDWILRECGLSSPRTVLPIRRSVNIARFRRVVEEYGQWFVVEVSYRQPLRKVTLPRKLLLNGTFRVTHRITDKETGKIFLYGYLRNKDGRRGRFLIEELFALDRKKLFPWIQRHAIAMRLGEMSFDGRRSRKAGPYEISVAFNKPKEVVGHVDDWNRKMQIAIKHYK